MTTTAPDVVVSVQVASDPVVSVQVESPAVISTVIEAGVPGPPGPQGPPGEGGGTHILAGTAPPTDELGGVGDFYLDTDDQILYGPKQADTGGLEPPVNTMGTVTPSNVFGGGFSIGQFFTLNQAGQVTGLRFYKTANAATSRTLKLWNQAGSTVLGTGTTTEVAGASGWVEATLGTPVTVTVGQIVVASYDAPESYGFVPTTPTSLVTSVTIGLCSYGGLTGFPSSTRDGSHFVDLIFRAEQIIWPVGLIGA